MNQQAGRPSFDLRRAGLLGLLALLHLGLGGLMIHQLRTKPSVPLAGAGRPTLLIPLWLKPGRASPPEARRSERQASSPPASKAARSKAQPLSPSSADARPGAITLPALGPAAAAASAMPAQAGASAPVPLNLQLPGTAAERAQAAQNAKHPAWAATQDPRSNSPRQDMGERMAQALGSDPSRVETITGDGKRRLRQGSTCVDMAEARIARLDPFNQGIMPTPALNKLCDK